MKNYLNTEYRIIPKSLRLLFGSIFLFLNCATEEALPVTADFSLEIVDGDYSIPVLVSIKNTTEGGEDFLWDFGNGNPNTSTDKQPGIIAYDEHGTYTIRLEASNEDGSFNSKEMTITLADAITIGFEPTIIENNYAPMKVEINNTTLGATSYIWTFEGGSPSSSNEQHPSNVIFNEPGEHIIGLQASNGQDVFQTQETVTVAPYLEAFFSYEFPFEDDDFQVPFTLNMNNESISATSYMWTIENGQPQTTTEQNPQIVLSTPGTYTIQLEATNGKETKTKTENITVYANTNLRTIENIKLGINTAHSNNTLGAFFSTTTREVYTKDQVTETNGSLIDIVFFGLNSTFTFNKFITPNEAASSTFDAIPNATHTQFINLQESCACSASLSSSQFDNMQDDSLLSELDIEETDQGLEDFDDSLLPRIILFENQQGIKGAIKIKEFVTDGQNSYVLVDIKMQKEAY
ncbi:PKD domain-containing protein [Aquimarina pacifica]|uniref:PKD domain-containing protein n=1 Tax=Aquimarina pacifica TaxID=1296415 RepID=UPI0004708D7F|nr:PKD domain-containing protein [Aquimarina pacifica]